MEDNLNTIIEKEPVSGPIEKQSNDLISEHCKSLLKVASVLKNVIYVINIISFVAIWIYFSYLFDSIPDRWNFFLSFTSSAIITFINIAITMAIYHFVCVIVEIANNTRRRL